jgi:hypothetical protein
MQQGALDMKFDRSDRRQRRKMRDLKRWSAAPETDSHEQWVSRRPRPMIEQGEHLPDCKHPGFRYAATVRRTKETIASGKAGKVVMVCKSGCPAQRIV